MNPVAALLFVITTVNFFQGAIVFFRNRRGTVYLSLARFIFLVGVWTFCMGAFYQVNFVEYARLWIVWTYVAGVLIANSLVYFALIYPEGIRLPLWQTFAVYLPAIPFLFFLIFVPNFLFKEIVIYDWWKDVILGRFEYTLYTFYFIVVYFGAIFIIWKKYLAYQGKTKLQLLYLLSAVFIAGSFGAFFDLVYPWIGLYKYIWLGPIGTLVMVSIFMYATIKHSLLDIKFVVARTIAYTLLIGTVAVFYSGVFFTVSSLFFPLADERLRLVFTVLSTVVLMITFQYLRDFFARITNRIFFRNAYDSNELLSRLTQIMASTLHLQELAEKTLQDLLDTMNITKGAFLLFQGSRSFTTIARGGYVGTIKFTFEQVSFLYSQGRVLVFDEELDHGVKEVMRILDVSVATPLYVGSSPIGILILGQKKSGDIYSSQDANVLRIFGPEVAVAIQNAEAYEEISRFNVTLREEITRATSELREANEKLKSLDKLKDEFLSVAAHELRTPMTAIKSYLWMVLHGKGVGDAQKQKFYLGRSYSSTERLINLVNDMLNVSRIEGGRMKIEKKLYGLKQLVDEVFGEVMPRAQELGLTLTLDAPDTLPQIMMDTDKIKEVVINLVGNSLKFTPSGGKITVKVWQEMGFLYTAVSDTGRGIKKEDMDKLFKKFGMIESAYTSATQGQGTGLGLYITQQIVALHGGKIWVNSEFGHGSTFTFTLPVNSNQLTSNPSTALRASQGSVEQEPVAVTNTNTPAVGNVAAPSA